MQLWQPKPSKKEDILDMQLEKATGKRDLEPGSEAISDRQRLTS
jgi:hypothetical protein